MRKTLLIRLVVLLPLLTGCGGTGNVEKDASDAEMDEESLYQVPSRWLTQNGDTVTLSSFSGKLPVVAMVFTHCPFACPRIVDEMKKIEQSLPAGKGEAVVFVLVSFDTERDHPARLREFAREMQLGSNWVLLHGGEEEVRELSMLLDVSYKKQPGGDFAHSNIITLLDKRGRIVKRIEGLAGNTAALTAAVNDML